MDWNAIATALMSTSVVLLVLGYLGKTVIESWLAARLDSHKSDLERQNEQFALTLKIQEFEHQVRFRSLHERQAIVIANTHRLLYELLEAVKRLKEFHGDADPETKGEQFREAQSAYRALLNYFTPRELYLSTETAGKVKDVAQTLAGVSSTANLVHTGQLAPDTRVKYNNDATEELNEAHALMVGLRQEFRSIIGMKLPADRPTP